MLGLTSIRSKLLAIFFIAGAVPIVGVSLISYYNSIRAVEEMVGNRTLGITGAIGEEIDRKLDRRVRDDILRVNEPVQEFLLSRALRDAEAFQAAQTELVRYITQLFQSYEPFYDGILLADAAGRPLFKFHRSAGVEGSWTQRATEIEASFAEPPGDYPEEIPLPPPTAVAPPAGSALTLVEVQPVPEAGAPPVRVFQSTSGDRGIGDEDRVAARRGVRMGREEYRFVTDIPLAGGGQSVRLIRPVFSNEDPERRLGTIVTNLRLDYLFREDLATERFGEFGEIAIVNTESGEILYHSDRDVVGKKLRLADADLARALEPDRVWPTLWGKASGSEGLRLVAATPLEDAPWTVVATALPREFQREARRAGLLNLIVASAAVLVAGLVLILSSRRISRSIQTVTAGAREIAAGNLGLSIHVETHDEIQILADTFNQMTRSLSENIALRERAARELEALNRTLEDRVKDRTRELEQLNAALNQANRELTELDRLKTNFLSTVSHEFKTPLTSIKAFAEILLDEAAEVEGTAHMQRFLRIIHSESERLGRLIKNVLSMSQIESGRIVWHMTDFPIREAVEAAVDGLLPVLREHRVTVDRQLACPQAVVHGDVDRIQEVITNLIENAVKYSEAGQQVTLSCAPDDGGPPGKSRVRITVRDEGAGIPEDHLETVFERFSQVDPADTRRKGGTGLGLAICREIVEHHGGRIWAESEPGQGAAFHFTLPLSGDPLAQGGDRAEARARL